MAPAYRIDDSDIFLTASVGIALFPIHGRQLRELTGAADAAMFEIAIVGGNGCRVADLPAPAEVGVELADGQSGPP
jgi:GGDEF domain-containing protein